MDRFVREMKQIYGEGLNEKGSTRRCGVSVNFRGKLVSDSFKDESARMAMI